MLNLNYTVSLLFSIDESREKVAEEEKKYKNQG